MAKINLGDDWEIENSDESETVVRNTSTGNAFQLQDDGTLLADSVGSENNPQTATLDDVSLVGNGIKQARSPSVTAEERYPNVSQPYRILWADGQTLYGALPDDKAVYKSTDGGDTWSVQATAAGLGAGTRGAFLKLPGSGTLLTVSGTDIWRSADDGVNWSQTHSFRTDTNLLGVNGWDFDPTNDDVYYIEYQTSGLNSRVYRSTDDGQTFTQFHEFTGPRHGHGVAYDPVSGRMFFMTGDNESGAGIFRTDGAGGVEDVVLNSNTPNGNDARSIGMMFFDGHLCWPTDAPDNAYLYRMPRSDIGASNPTIEQIYRVNSSGWWTVEAAPNREAYLVSASNEGSQSLDNAVHLYYVTNEGLDVYEVGSFPVGSTNGIPNVGPVGTPRQGGDEVWLQSQFIDREFQTKALVSESGFEAYPITQTQQQPPSVDKTTISSGEFTVSAGANETFHETVPASQASTDDLIIYNYGITALPSSSSTNVRLWVYNNDTLTKEVNDTVQDARNQLAQQHRPFIDSIEVGSSETISFRAVETGGSSSATVQAFVTYGWA